MEEFVKWIDCIEDVRQQSKIRYTVQEIVLIVFCATLAGVYDWEDMELWANLHLDYFRGSRPESLLENGYPLTKTVSQNT